MSTRRRRSGCRRNTRWGLETASTERKSETEGAFRFEPDGSSSGGHIDVVFGQKHVRIGVDWLSGRVSVANAK